MFKSPVLVPEVRNDIQGLGKFGATRGYGFHRGVDLLSTVGETIVAPCRMTIRRIGYPYSTAKFPDRAFLKLIVGESQFGFHKIFYVDPIIKTGDFVSAGQPIGKTQDIASVHLPGMKNHIHWELQLPINSIIDTVEATMIDGNRIDPMLFIDLRS